MESYLIHIYRRDSSPDLRNDTDTIGMVEGIESEKHYPFTNPDELWDIVTGKNPADFAAGQDVDNKKGRDEK